MQNYPFIFVGPFLNINIDKMKILMVCLGNICRSPLAEGIMEQKVLEKGLDWTIDSAGTGSWHIGEAPDSRSVYTAKRHGIDITNQRGAEIQALRS